MDSIKREEANISHHQSKVVPSNSASQSQKSSTNSNNNNTSNNRNQQSGEKESNFDDDNEWDIGIGDLIIDLDADIEKSSKQSSDNPTVNIPIQNPTHSRAESAGRSAYDKSLPAPKPTQKSTATVTSIRTKSNLEKFEKEEPATMSSTNSNNKTNAKLSIDHQATLDKGLKMKIKRTKTGTKTSEAKHEIVKAEQNGATTSSDEGPAPVSNKKPHSQNATSSLGNAAAPSTATSNKRGTSGHRKEKTKEKPPHGPRDKSEAAVTGPSDKTCSCGSDMTTNGVQTGCSNLICMKNRDNDMSLAQRLSSSHIKLSLGGERQTILGNTPNVPGLPKDLNKTNSQSQSHNQPSSNSNSSSSSHSVGLQHSSESTLKAQLSSTSLAAALSNSSSASSISAPSSNSTSDDNVSSPPVKRIKCDPKDMKDVCVGTSVGTITEPDHLGPCEPGTSVTLEGIVWHETEGGVLAVNVTWRGKTYVGTLIDCTKHDWAPPRFCDSPTEELDSRTPKGRGKRGRSANTPTNDLSNFTETRSSVHSKLRNGGAKGRGGRNSSSTGLNPNASTSCSIVNVLGVNNNAGSNTPSTSPTAFLVPRPEKRKSKDESPQPNGSSSANSVNGSSSTQSVTNPVTGNPVQISVKKVKTLTTPCAISPVLLECPEQDCSKKYKHANGLKYHQSHAHGSVSSVDEDSSQAPESPQRPARSNSPVVASNPSLSTLTTNSTNMPATPIALNAISSPAGNVCKDSLPVTAPLTPKASVIAQESSSITQAHSLTGILTVNPLTQNPTNNKSLTASNTTSAADGTTQNLGCGITTTPVRTDTQAKTKPGVLRFGPLPDPQPSQLPQNRPSINPLSDQQSPIYPPNQQNSQNNLLKSQNLSKQKKNRKSPGPGDYDTVSNRADDVRSPAYSDISDDSTPVADIDLNDKSKVSHLVDVKKPQEPGALSSMSSLTSPYSQYPFNSVYQQGFFSSEAAQGVKSALSQPLLQSAPADYQKNKEPPLDLMNKSQSSEGSMKDGPGGNNSQQGSHPGKLMPHYNYPYNSYLPPSYPYNLDPSFNPMSMMTDEAKMASQNPGIKDIPSPNDHSKMVNPQMISSKMNIKSEPKEIKQEMQHTKDQQAPTQPPQNFGPYSGLYHQQRHGLSMPPSREEELRRYYIYPPEQRRSSGPGQTATNLSAKDERSSQSPHATTPSPVQHSASSMHSSQQTKSMKSSSGSSSSSQQPANLSSSQKSSSKEIKEEKEVKVKQEGQKPTMETQGPPPPPTSQYYLHPPYMGPGPFGYDPSLPMYRNMMVPSPAYSNPYLAQMTRFQTPEDLSRNPNTKALDLLQQHANQYAYNPHKIHELSERALKSPTSNVKVSVSSPSIATQQQGPPGSRELGGNPNGGNNGGSIGGPSVGNSGQTNALQKGPGGPLNSNPSQPGSIASLNQAGSINSINSKNLTKGGDLSADRGSLINNSPPTQRHVHTHTHHHILPSFPNSALFPQVPYNKIG